MKTKTNNDKGTMKAAATEEGIGSTQSADETRAAQDRWIAKNSYPLVPEAGLSLVSLTGQDYPKLRKAFAEAWKRMLKPDVKRLLASWRKGKKAPYYPRLPWIVALPSWPCRDKDEFALTETSGYSIRFIGPLFEIMPDEIAVGCVIRELTFAYYLVGQGNHNPRWAVTSRKVWGAKFEEEVAMFTRCAGISDFKGDLQKWITGNAELEQLSAELDAHACWLHDAVGEHAALILS